MNRDALLATIIGFAVGLLLAAGVLLGPKLIAQIPNFRLPSLTSPAQNPGTAVTGDAGTTTAGDHTLTVESPLSEAISDTASIVVSGSTNPDSIVIVAGLTDEDVVSVGSDGKYTGKITLLEGKNDLVITSILQGKTISQNLLVYYSSVKL